MAKTVSAIVKLIDNFSGPSSKVSDSAKNLQAKLKYVGTSVSAVGDIMSNTGSVMTKGVTAPIMALGTSSIAAFKEVSSGMEIVIQKTGATGDALDGMKTVFDNVASSIPESFDNVGTAVGEVNTRFGFTGDQLEKASETFLKFADINKTDVGSAISLVSRAMSDAGIDSKEYSSVLNSMNAVGQATGISMDSLASNMAKYGAPMRALGIDTQTSIAMFAGWEKAGVNTSIAFSGMKSAISNWSAEGKDASKEFGNVMEQIKSAPDISSATTLAIETFGKKAGPDLADAIRGGRFEVEEYLDVIENAGGSVDNTFETTQTGIDKFSTAMNTVKVALSEFGNKILTVAAPYIDKLAGKIKDISKWFNSLSDSQKKSIVKFAGIAAAVGPVLMVVGKLVSRIGGAITSFGRITAAVSKVGSVFSLIASPAGAVIGIIAAVAAAGILVYKNWDKIVVIVNRVKTKLVEFGKKAAEIASAAWEALGGFVTDVVNAFKDFGKTIGDKAKSVWTSVKGMAEKAGEHLGNFKDTVVEKAQGAWDHMKDFGEFVGDVFASAFETGLDLVGTYFGSWYDSIEQVIGDVQGVMNGIVDFFNNVFAGNWEGAWTNLRDIVGNAFGALKGLVAAPINAVIALVNKAIDGINSISFTLPDWVPLGLGGKGWDGLDIAHIPSIEVAAKGTDNWKGGILQINEKGGEIVDLPQGSRVYPHDESVRMAKNDAKRTLSVAIAKLADSIIVREEADIDKIANAIAKKIESVTYNMG